MDTDAKRPGEGVGSMRTPAGNYKEVKIWQNLADVFYGWSLTGSGTQSKLTPNIS